MKTIGLLIIIAGAALFCGCGATAPSELTGARLAYLQASEGPAAELAPAELHKAREALTRAEEAFQDDADSYRTRDLAYVAQRRAEMAEAHAGMAVDKASASSSNKQYNTTQGELLHERTRDLRDTRSALASSEQAEQATASSLVAEQRAHLVTEQRLAEQGVVMQEKAADLSDTRTALAVSEGSTRPPRRPTTAEPSVQRETPPTPDQRGGLVAQQAQEPPEPQAEPAVSEPTDQATLNQRVAAEVARREAERAAMAQSLESERTTQDLNQARTDLAVSEHASRTANDQLASEQRARLAAENKSTEQNRQFMEQTRALVQAETALAVSEQSLQSTTAKLTAEQKARQAAEATTTEAQVALAKLTATQDARGEVFTLSGGLLFRSNEATLMPGAELQLDRLVEALASTPDRDVMVQGYTDSQGSADHNLDLSQRRADTVRSYLVHRGFPADQVRAEGVGEASPISDNNTSEGRANNRRVEVVLVRAATP